MLRKEGNVNDENKGDDFVQIELGIDNGGDISPEVINLTSETPSSAMDSTSARYGTVVGTGSSPSPTPCKRNEMELAPRLIEIKAEEYFLYQRSLLACKDIDKSKRCIR